MAERINTVLGPREISGLGQTTMHEHFVYGFPGHQADYTLGAFDEEKTLPTLMKTAEKLKACGYETVLDATTIDCGRNAALLRTIAERSGLNIICTTGLYAENFSSAAYWMGRGGMGCDPETEIVEMLTAEATEGIAKTGIKAGVLKAASSSGEITDYEKMCFRAVGRAQKATGLCVITHTDGNSMGMEQADLLIGSGADPAKIMIGHMCGVADIGYHVELLKRGVYIGLDRFGLEGFAIMKTATDEERTELLIKLMERGYTDRLLLGHDTVTHDLGRPWKFSPDAQKFKDHSHVGVISEYVIPRLKARGVGDDQIHKLTIENPRAFLSR